MKILLSIITVSIFFSCSSHTDLPAYTVVNEDLGKSKCNLQKGSYTWNEVLSTDQLEQLAIGLANRLQNTAQPTPGCDYPVMAQIAIYNTKSDIQNDEGSYIAMCVISAPDFKPEVTLGHQISKQP